MNVLPGIEAKEEFHKYSRLNIGLIVHPASVTSSLQHTVDVFFENFPPNVKAIFGPQHGIHGETQDNMVEWRSFRDARMGIPFFSLYGDTRKPTKEMLAGLDVLFFDLQDVGSRYYTFIWTMLLCMEAAHKNKLKFVVLDRPNPINGTDVSGPSIEKGFESFVGLKSIPVRHGMTVGELGRYFNGEFGIDCDLEVIAMQGWKRGMYFDETGLPWILPSPNMPTLDTALVYPGGCLLEGTNISEGRGTTRPFEIVGAPYMDSQKVIKAMLEEGVNGAYLREAHFIPTFNKHLGKECHGFQIHVTDRKTFDSFATIIKLLKIVYRFWPDQFEWNRNPYEYEFEKPAFDILTGNSRIRMMVEADVPYPAMEDEWKEDLERFRAIRQNYLLYSE